MNRGMEEEMNLIMECWVLFKKNFFKFYLLKKSVCPPSLSNLQPWVKSHMLFWWSQPGTPSFKFLRGIQENFSRQYESTAQGNI